MIAKNAYCLELRCLFDLLSKSQKIFCHIMLFMIYLCHILIIFGTFLLTTMLILEEQTDSVHNILKI